MEAKQLMRFEFTPTPEDYKKVIRIYYLSDTRIWVILALFGLPQLCCSLYIITQNGLKNNLLPLLLLLLFPLFIVYLLVLMPLSFAQRVKNNERMKAKTTWMVSEEQIIIKNEYSESKLTWDAYQRVIESRAFYLLFAQGQKGLFQMLPKRAFFTVDQELAFQKMVSNKVKKYRVLQYF
jgi:YcxB-like protein